MDKTITNQASITYLFEGNQGSAQSNTVSMTVVTPLGISVLPLGNSYRSMSTAVQIITLTNRSKAPLTGVRVTDDLGSYTLSGTDITSLRFKAPAELFSDGVFISSVDTDITDVGDNQPISFTIPVIPASGNVQLIYAAEVKNTALLERGSSIVRTISAQADNADSVSAQSTVFVESYADVRIVKSMYPTPLMAVGGFVCELSVYNSGNSDATNVFITDTFTAKPSVITAELNDTALSSDEYSYDANTGRFVYPKIDSENQLSVPMAEFSQNSETGVVSITPSQVKLVITAQST